MQRTLWRALLGVMMAPMIVSCGGAPDPRTLEGATAYALLALEQNDAERLYRVIDARARHAMISVVKDRGDARALIERSYPAPERAPALATLGEASQVSTPMALFALRCNAECRSGFSESLGAVTATRTEGAETIAHTTRDVDVRWYRKRSTDWWGLVWNTEALAALAIRRAAVRSSASSTPHTCA